MEQSLPALRAGGEMAGDVGWWEMGWLVGDGVVRGRTGGGMGWLEVGRWDGER